MSVFKTNMSEKLELLCLSAEFVRLSDMVCTVGAFNFSCIYVASLGIVVCKFAGGRIKEFGLGGDTTA